ncbi:MAG TPA: type II toxin-antitoxin system prevent-host-death family antitoxin [Arachnia sp.]|nr:type II toxin-antitoxin system prevent-host-death family antitoxin [Arachnia sp.]HMT85387.1 type II toxin-antitoxin system prevent-host-death family antitoxin [Arachnia sp.]
MKTITVGELRQNPTAALDDVERGDTYRITRHNREIGRIVPPTAAPDIVSPKRRGRANTSAIPRHELHTVDSIDELLDQIKGEW